MLFRRTSFTALAARRLGLGTAAPSASANITMDETSTVPANGTFVVEATAGVRAAVSHAAGGSPPVGGAANRCPMPPQVGSRA